MISAVYHLVGTSSLISYRIPLPFDISSPSYSTPSIFNLISLALIAVPE
jgi:hypothetical protein